MIVSIGAAALRAQHAAGGETFTFDLGLDAFLQVNTSGGVSAAINPVLNIGFDLTNGVPSLDPTHTGLDIGFVIGLPNFQLTASLNG